MSEPGSDYTPWGLNIFDVDHNFTSNYYGNSNPYDVNISSEQYMSDCDYDTTGHALGDEFTRLSVGDSPETLPIIHEYYQGSTVSEDCHSPSRPYYSGYRFGPVDMDDAAPSTSYSGPEDGSFDTEMYSYDLEITEESELDGEVGKRLNQMIPVPHVPRINGDIPSVHEATSDHQRLLDRLQLYDLVEHKVQGDGNCQFRALSDQVYRTPEHHESVRQQVVSQLQAHPEMYEGYVPMEYSEYINRMSKNGEWGDHVTLQAAADMLFASVFGRRCTTTQFIPKEMCF
ncbi:OVARIAN TUMOR DOMAIN-containing deubiquitinating enzyme 12 isoform X2 [Coffea arabica]|uniref:OVARIAN TUMOR DOMAIN-containing deubiquitinating enzyme 12 isoform X2 n=1 Tax=Coffea arabica TaxID=13443 RepID=A0ABM4UTE2_COFAR